MTIAVATLLCAIGQAVLVLALFLDRFSSRGRFTSRKKKKYRARIGGPYRAQLRLVDEGYERALALQQALREAPRAPVYCADCRFRGRASGTWVCHARPAGGDGFECCGQEHTNANHDCEHFAKRWRLFG